MKGRAYARGLQQLTVGVYLSEFCLIGLFAIGTASSTDATGPLILMIIFAALTVIYHVMMKKVLGPLINGLEMVPGTEGQNGAVKNQDDVENGVDGPANGATPHRVGGIRGKCLHFFFGTAFAHKWFYPKKSLAAHFDDSSRSYTDAETRDAYLPPAVTSQPKTIWIARDEYGLSHQEVAGCREFNLNATDEEATLNEKGAVQWNNDRIREAPVYQEYVPY